MPTSNRHRFPRPALWIAVPVFFVGMAVVAVEAIVPSLPVAIVISALGAFVVGCFAESRLAGIIASISAIAGGDRYTSLPELVGDGAIQDFTNTAGKIRTALLEADTLAVDQGRRETEARLHHAGQHFFTGSFRRAVDDVVSTFTSAGERIRGTAAELAQTNKLMAQQVMASSDAAEQAAEDVADVAAAARDVQALAIDSGRQVDEARAATTRTVTELARADETMRNLAEAAGRIEQVIKLIQAIAGQTSLLALNATIEAARAGESGRGFAVVAAEVKELSRRTETATREISTQVHGIQDAVKEAAEAIVAVDQSVAAMSHVNENVTRLMEQQVAKLDLIGTEARKVAATVSEALPGIRSVVSDVANAGDAVLTTADDLIGRAQLLTSSVNRYFADLDHGSIKVGILHSLSGTLTTSERPLQQMLVMLIEKLNEAGGLLGRPVEAAIMDPRSDTGAYAAKAEALLRDHKVAAIFGCWTSASRKQVLPVLSKYDGLLFYPSQYEGQEQSPHVIYTGATPRQQAIPAVDYLLEQGRRRFFLVGTDYVYPRTTNAIIRNYLGARGISADAVDEHYTPFGEKSWGDIVHRIRKFAGRDGAIIATLSGDSNVHFFRERARQGLDANILPVMSLSIGEAEMPALAERNLVGHMVAWNYLQSIDTPENHAFIAEWRRFTGDENAITNDPMEASWIGFHLWVQSVMAAGTTEPQAVRRALAGRSLRAPSGFDVRLDAENQHLHKPSVIGRMDANNMIWPVKISDGLIAPEPWSSWLSKDGQAWRKAG
ncbi:MAG: transporter substrate-binding protein [Rhodopseudomonas sp.]|nr:transporter substrate-binding protein [Rhodopseudomonas sp.]